MYDHTENLVSITEIKQRTGLTLLRDLTVKQAALVEINNRKADALCLAHNRFYGRKRSG